MKIEVTTDDSSITLQRNGHLVGIDHHGRSIYQPHTMMTHLTSGRIEEGMVYHRGKCICGETVVQFVSAS